METPGERPPTRLRIVYQEGWDGARRHPQPAAGVQSAEQWCSSQSQPQPQLRYQHGSSTGHAALSSWPVADQNRRSRDFQQNQQLAGLTLNRYAEDFNGHRADEGYIIIRLRRSMTWQFGEQPR